MLLPLRLSTLTLSQWAPWFDFLTHTLNMYEYEHVQHYQAPFIIVACYSAIGLALPSISALVPWFYIYFRQYNGDPVHDYSLQVRVTKEPSPGTLSCIRSTFVDSIKEKSCGHVQIREMTEQRSLRRLIYQRGGAARSPSTACLTVRSKQFYADIVSAFMPNFTSRPSLLHTVFAGSLPATSPACL